MMPSSSILALLHLAAQARPDNGLTFVQEGSETTITYAQLRHIAQENASLLRDAGIVTPGKIVMTYFDDHMDNIVWFWSIAAAGGVPAILPSFATNLKIRESQIANVEHIFNKPIVVTSQRLARDLNSRTKLQFVTTSNISRPSDSVKETLHVDFHNTNGGDLAAILFTSGSTGPSKAVEFSHSQLLSSVASKAAFHMTHPDMKFGSWISFDHSANFCEIHLNALFSCSNQVHMATTDLATQPAHFFHFLSRYQIGYTFLPNAFLAAATRTFSAQDYCANFNLDKLSVIMCGGEGNRTSTIAAGDALLVRLGAHPHTIKSAYGLSETCSACFYNKRSPLYDLQQDYEFASVGIQHSRNLELRVLDQDGNNQIPFVPGAIQLRGDVVFKRYHNNDADTKACMTPDNWFDTGDVGFLDSKGNLRIIGRAKEIIIINGQNYSSSELEYAIECTGLAGITPSYLATFSSWDNSRDSESVVVLFNFDEANGTHSLLDTIKGINKAVLGYCAKQPLAIISLPKEQMPKSTIGKLSRRRLKDQFEAGSFAQYRTSFNDSHLKHAPKDAPMATESGQIDEHINTLSVMERRIGEIFANYTDTPLSAVFLPDALHNLGVDSIGYMRITKSLQEAFRFDKEIPMAKLVSCSSVHELEQTLLSSGTVQWEYDPIVALSVCGSKTPLFMIHGGGGEILQFMALTKFLDDRPVYALRAKGLHAGEATFGSIEAMIDFYLEAITRIKSHGPYAILGYSIGGTVAFELAKKLEAGGAEVVFAGGIDNPPDSALFGRPAIRTVMLEILPGLSTLTKEEAQDFGTKTAHLSEDDFMEVLFHLIRPDVVDDMDLTVSRFQGYARVLIASRGMLQGYRPTGSVSKWDCFRALPDALDNISVEEWWTVHMRAWDRFCRSEVQYHDLDGDHVSCFREPNIDCLQRQINRALLARGI